MIDRFILPSREIPDTILQYAKVTQSRSNKVARSTSVRGYKFYTANDFEFSTDRAYISEPEITIEHTLLFKNIISVRTKDEDITHKLLSGLGGFNCIFYLTLAFSSTISLLFLFFKPEISENAFLNIWLFNAFMLFVLGIIWINV